MGKKNNFMNAWVIQAFAYGPENPESRGININNRGKLEIFFDMTKKPRPECAGISLKFDREHRIPKELKLNFFSSTTHNENENNFCLLCELKIHGNKVEEYNVLNGHLHIDDLDPSIDEIVFVCFGERNADMVSVISVENHSKY